MLRFHFGNRHIIYVQSPRAPLVLQLPWSVDRRLLARPGVGRWPQIGRGGRELLQRFGAPWQLAGLGAALPGALSLPANARIAASLFRRKTRADRPTGLAGLFRASGLQGLWPVAVTPMRQPSGAKRRQRTEIEIEGPEIEIKGFDPRDIGAAVRWTSLLSAATVGGLAVYLLDPQQGRRRRRMAMDRGRAMARRAMRQAGRYARVTSSQARGLQQRMTHLRRAPQEPPDDVTLAHKVETVLFRDPRIPKGNINVNAEHGTVVLRGEVEHPEDIREIVRRVRRIDDVIDVRSLLHLVHTPAP